MTGAATPRPGSGASLTAVERSPMMAATVRRGSSSWMSVAVTLVPERPARTTAVVMVASASPSAGRR